MQFALAAAIPRSPLGIPKPALVPFPAPAPYLEFLMSESFDPRYDPRQAAFLISQCRELFGREWDEDPALQARTTRSDYIDRRDREEILDDIRPEASFRGHAPHRSRQQLKGEWEANSYLQAEFPDAACYAAFALAAQAGNIRTARSVVTSHRRSDFLK